MVHSLTRAKAQASRLRQDRKHGRGRSEVLDTSANRADLEASPNPEKRLARCPCPLSEARVGVSTGYGCPGCLQQESEDSRSLHQSVLTSNIRSGRVASGGCRPHRSRDNLYVGSAEGARESPEARRVLRNGMRGLLRSILQGGCRAGGSGRKTGDGADHLGPKDNPFREEDI